MEIKVKKNTKKFNEFTVTMKLTEGAVLSVLHALQVHSEMGSAIASDVLGFLKRAAEEAGIHSS